MECITYKAGYKYQLREAYLLLLPDIRPAVHVETDYLALDLDGLLIVKQGYAWDGPSGPARDTLNFMRASLVHDALYQLMRDGYLDREDCRNRADRLLQHLCREDGMGRLRAWYVYWGTRLFGDPAADPAHDKPLIRAPKACR